MHSPPSPTPARPPPHPLLQELDAKSDAFGAERRKATDTILDLQRRLAEAESTAERLKADHARLAEKLEAQRVAAEVRTAAVVGWMVCQFTCCFFLCTLMLLLNCHFLLLSALRHFGAACMQEASARLRSVREEAAVKQESFEKEVGMAQRMAQLYRESRDERAAKCTELEGVVQELKAHMEVRGAEGWGWGWGCLLVLAASREQVHCIIST